MGKLLVNRWLHNHWKDMHHSSHRNAYTSAN